MEEVRLLQAHSDTCPKGEDSNLIFTVCNSGHLLYRKRLLGTYLRVGTFHSCGNYGHLPGSGG